MKRMAASAAIFILVSCTCPGCGGAAPEQETYLRHNRDFDRRTEIRKSGVPGAGMGLYALVDIRKGEIIGEYGGTLTTGGDYPMDDAYVANLPDCALKQLKPYRYVDGRESDAHVTRANFAPKRINGTETDFQNAEYAEKCSPPYLFFVAARDIKKGEEIFVSYGPNYRYEFMKDKAVQRFFCGKLAIDCSVQFSFEE
jgi:SET domain-containing protein